MAETVCRPVYELENDLPLLELLEWRAFWKLKAKAEEKATAEAKRKAKTKGGKR